MNKIKIKTSLVPVGCRSGISRWAHPSLIDFIRNLSIHIFIVWCLTNRENKATKSTRRPWSRKHFSFSVFLSPLILWYTAKDNECFDNCRNKVKEVEEFKRRPHKARWACKQRKSIEIVPADTTKLVSILQYCAKHFTEAIPEEP